MQKLILTSIVFANIAIPVWAAHQKRARAGLERGLVVMMGFNVLYLLAVVFLYPRF